MVRFARRLDGFEERRHQLNFERYASLLPFQCELDGTYRLPNNLRTHCLKGHPFDEANTYFYGKKRRCRRCNDVRPHRRRSISKATDVAEGELQIREIAGRVSDYVRKYNRNEKHSVTSRYGIGRWMPT